MKKTLRTATIITGIALVGLITASCNLPILFAGYTGVNLISSQGFNSSPQQWKIWNSKTTTVTYLTFAAVSSTVAGGINGLPSTNDGLYLLNAPNLVANGDFEAGISGWTQTGTAVAAATTTAPDAITGQSLQFRLLGGTDRVDYLLDSNIQGLAVNNIYRVLFDFNVQGTSTAEFDFNNGTTSYLGTPWTVTTTGATLATIHHFPTSNLSSQFTITSASNNYFSIGRLGAGSINSEQGDLDNFRIAREDLDSYLQLSVPYSATGRSDLISGTYEFSVWVKAQEASQVTPAAANQFPATGLTLGINTARQAFVINNGVVAPPSPYSEPITLSSTTWQKVSMKASVQVNPPATGSTTVIDLSIAPTNIYAKDVGGILISTPTLTFLPNG